MARFCPTCRETIDDERLVACPKCHNPLRESESGAPLLSPGQLRQVVREVRKKIVKQTIVVLGVLSLITGFSLWSIKNRLEALVIERIAAQFEEPHISATLQRVANGKAEQLLEQQIRPSVDHFNAQTKVLLDQVQESKGEIETAKQQITGLRSDFALVEKGIVEIQFLVYAGHNIFPNPYHDKIIAKLNELAAIAVPDPVQRAQYIAELQEYAAKKRGDSRREA